MTIKIVTSFTHLCRLAREEHNAKKFGTPEQAEEAKRNHQAYKELCLQADEMLIPTVWRI